MWPWNHKGMKVNISYIDLSVFTHLRSTIDHCRFRQDLRFGTFTNYHFQWYLHHSNPPWPQLFSMELNSWGLRAIACAITVLESSNRRSLSTGWSPVRGRIPSQSPDGSEAQCVTWSTVDAGYEADLRKLTSAQQMWRQLEPDARGRSGVTAQRLSQLAHPSPLTPHKSASPLSSQSPPQHDILLGNKED